MFKEDFVIVEYVPFSLLYLTIAVQKFCTWTFDHFMKGQYMCVLNDFINSVSVAKYFEIYKKETIRNNKNSPVKYYWGLNNILKWTF